MEIRIANYLLESLKKYGVNHIFGVPGDYNLSFLDSIEDFNGIEWIGNCNELNASYAADGYARIKGMGAIVTTFGPGELSAINGIAGSYAEKVPVVKIVGRPSFNVVTNKSNVHHTLGNGDFNVFYDMYSKITGAQCILTTSNAQSEIDRVLDICFTEKVPVYIEIPSDIATQKIDVILNNVKNKLQTNKIMLDKFIGEIKNLLNESIGQAILADYEISRYQLEKQLDKFIKTANIPYTTLSMGKGVVDESSKYFMGTYNGILSNETIKNVAQHTDLLITIGAIFTDSTTAGFSKINKNIKIIEIHSHFCKIGDIYYNNLLVEDVLEELAKLNFFNKSIFQSPKTLKFIPTNNLLTQKRMFEAIQDFLKENDILIAEQGTSFFGASELVLPKNSLLIGQPLWGSIGYTLGALLGTQLANIERRNILLIGDGSFQLTAQEISTILRCKLKPIIMILNNDGYTVERLIHGPTRKYNDINMWKYSELPKVLNLDDMACTSLSIKTEMDLYEGLKLCKNNNKLIFMELHLNAEDAPELLKKLGKLFKLANNY